MYKSFTIVFSSLIILRFARYVEKNSYLNLIGLHIVVSHTNAFVRFVAASLTTYAKKIPTQTLVMNAEGNSGNVSAYTAEKSS